MESKAKFRPDPKLKLMDQVTEVLRYHHYAYRTEQTYSQWIRRYIFFGIYWGRTKIVSLYKSAGVVKAIIDLLSSYILFLSTKK